MKSITTCLLCLFLTFLVTSSCVAQLPGIGHWRVHIPYFNPESVVDAGAELYVSNELAVYSYDKSEFAIQRFSKVNLLSDIGVRKLFRNELNGAIVIVYSNSNIDVLLNDELFNFSFIRNQNIVGDKSVYHASFLGDSAYLSCGFGVVVLDLVRQESPATYFFQTSSGTPVRVNSTSVFQNRIYAATENGLYSGTLSTPLLEDFSVWEQELPADGLPEGEIFDLFEWNNLLYAYAQDSIYYATDGSDWLPALGESGWDIKSAVVKNDMLLLTEHKGTVPPAEARVRIYDETSLVQTVQENFIPVPMQATSDASGDVWIADLFRGLVRYQNETDFEIINPNGPATSKTFDMASMNGGIFVAPGDVNGSWNKEFNADGFFRFQDGSWKNFNQFNTDLLDSVTDILAVTTDPTTETVWFGSFGSGLLELRPDGTLEAYKQNSALQGATGDLSNYRVAGVALDGNGHLWMANNGAPESVVLRTKGGEWHSFDSGLPASAGEAVGQCVVDDFGQLWFVVVRGNGILVYDPGVNRVDPSDDIKKQLGLGAGNGNLHTNSVLCLAKDLDGEIWVGTEEGITVFYNPGASLQPGTSGDAAQIIVELDGVNSLLFDEEIVNVITVDGANRKWIGTENGVFLVSEDGREQLAYFNKGNSPLLDNSVKAIAIDGNTGEVFFGTDKGIISYRGEATSGGFEHSDVRVFPNPVRENYNGPIAIRGLVANADVKITDVSGKLVYETTALGGQAVWDGNGVDGDRAATGVYLVFSTDETGKEKFATRFLVVN